MFDDEPAGVKPQERHAGEVFGAAIDEPGVRGPVNRRPIIVDDRLAELTFSRRSGPAGGTARDAGRVK
jgi:hypothetical protein